MALKPRRNMENLQEALTFDDVLLVPAYSEVLPVEVDLGTRLTRGIDLNTPFVSAAMDTVTEAQLAIALAQEGGIGIIHKSMTVAEQAAQVRRVKKYESGVIQDPITVSPNTPVHEVIDLTHSNKISGVPVVDGDDLVGIVTHRDLRFETCLDEPVSSVMTPKHRLVTVQEGAGKAEVQKLLHKHRIEKVLVVNERFQLRGMITVKDFEKSSDYPNACRDEFGRLRVGAAVGIGEETQQRAEQLVKAQADVLAVDTAHGHSRAVLDMVRDIRKHFPEVRIIAGNIASAEAALALADCGVDAVKVGIGPGSICTTRVVAGVGVPQITAINVVSRALAGTDIPIIADGGVRFSGDAAKAIAAGAHVVMIGSLFAGTHEAPGQVELYQGRSYKSYRGMGSLSAMKRGSGDRYFQDHKQERGKLVPEGIEGRVPYRGSVVDVVEQLAGGVRASMGYVGCGDIAEMRSKPKFVRITQAGMEESHAHSVVVTKEAPNYRGI